MKEYKLKVTVLADGRIEIEELPVRQGDTVEVTVRIHERVPPSWPLRGLPVKLHDPFAPATDPSEWDAIR